MNCSVVVSLLILSLGVAIMQTPVDILPSINIPAIGVVLTYTGLSPQDIQERPSELSLGRTGICAALEHGNDMRATSPRRRAAPRPNVKGDSLAVSCLAGVASQETSCHGRQGCNGRGNHVVIRSESKRAILLPDGKEIEGSPTIKSAMEKWTITMLRVAGEQRPPLGRKESCRANYCTMTSSVILG